jgi:hypothetical protein
LTTIAAYDSRAKLLRIFLSLSIVLTGELASTRVGVQVFGRCIAGRGFGGNFGYFKVILVCGYLGPLTTVAAVVASLVSRFGFIGVAFSVAIFAGVCMLSCVASAVFAVVGVVQCHGCRPLDGGGGHGGTPRLVSSAHGSPQPAASPPDGSETAASV